MKKNEKLHKLFCQKPGLHLSVFAEKRRERIANMISVNGCLRLFSIFGDTFSHFREKTVFESEKKEVRTVFYNFLTFSWRIDASVNHISGFSSIFTMNIHSLYSRRMTINVNPA